jgi:hypothetical protein
MDRRVLRRSTGHPDQFKSVEFPAQFLLFLQSEECRRVKAMLPSTLGAQHRQIAAFVGL